MSSRKMDLAFLLSCAAPVPAPSPYARAGWAEPTAPPDAPPALPPMSPPNPDSPYAPPPQRRPPTPPLDPPESPVHTERTPSSPSTPRSPPTTQSRAGATDEAGPSQRDTTTAAAAAADQQLTAGPREMNIDGVVVTVAGRAMQKLYAEGKMLVTPQARHECACGERFNRGLHYLYHLSLANPGCTPDNGPLYVCDYADCKSAFRRKTDRAKHISCVHTKLRPFKCMECGCGFFFQKDVRKHFETVHRKLRPFQCSHCSNCFGKKEHLKNHVNRTHLHIKPYGCNICDVSLASKHNLQSHLQSRGHKATAAALLSGGSGALGLGGMKSSMTPQGNGSSTASSPMSPASAEWASSGSGASRSADSVRGDAAGPSARAREGPLRE